MACSLCFKVTTPMIFRKPGEFTPFARGPHVTATSSPLPMPTTVLGAISSCLMDLKKSSCLKMEGVVEWHEELEATMNLSKEDWFRGPYLLLKTEGAPEIYVQHSDELILLDSLYSAVEVFSKEILENGFDGRLIRTMYDLLKKAPISFKDRVGIALENIVKGVREGFIYMAREVDYSKLIKKGDVYIAIDSSKDIKEVHNKIIGIGGERRIAKISIEEPFFIKKIKRELEKRKERIKGMLLYMVSHALFETPTTLREIKENLENNFKVNIKQITGRISIIGAGYSIRRGVRKPMYASLEPGSMILVEETDPGELQHVITSGLSGIASNLGFGTLVPIPLIEEPNIQKY